MLPEYFAIIGAIIASLGDLFYLYQTVLGKVKPNRMTWLLWGIFPMITFFAQRAQGVDSLSWVSFIAGFVCFFILGASFLNKKAYWKTSRLDFALVGIALVGLALWAVTDDPNLAIAFSIVADFFAGLPTILKAYKQPDTESWGAFAICTIGFGISLLAIHDFSFQTYAFVLYLFFNNLLITLLAARRSRPNLSS